VIENKNSMLSTKNCPDISENEVSGQFLLKRFIIYWDFPLKIA
jgi:hypothetical protein